MSARSEIYLDENATTRVLPLAAQEAQSVMEEMYGNPSSSHITGLRARQILESARSVAREVLGAPKGKIVFTSGATEAIQTGIFSALCAIKQQVRELPEGERGLLLYGATEHKAVPQALQHWNSLLEVGCDVVAIPVDFNGQLDLAFLREKIGSARMLCTMAVNNETGAIHDLSAIESIVQSADRPVAWLADCVQAIGKLQLDLSQTSIDYATFSGHKIYAPKGIGVLYVREGAPFTPLIAGGGQEGGARGGTENLPGVAAIAAVLRALLDESSHAFRSSEVLGEYRGRLISSLEQAFPDIEYNTPFEHSVPTTINFAVPGLGSKELLDLFDAAGIRVSSGSACGSAVQGSYVLEAMGLSKWRSDGAIRLSFGPSITAADVESACLRIEEAGVALTRSCLAKTGIEQGINTRQMDGLVQLKNGSDCSWILTSAESGCCVVVEPFEAMLDRIETLVACQGLKVVAVLDSHQHVDHESPREELVQRLTNRGLYEPKETDILGWPAKAEGQLRLGDESQAEFISLSDSLQIAYTELPGHTSDGHAFLIGAASEGTLRPNDVRFAFTGDTLLIGGIGRTDFDSSCPELMLRSLRKLPTILSPQSVICPTHDYNLGFVTTLASERKHNCLLSQILDSEFPTVADYLSIKAKVDSEIDDEKNCELVCGLIQNYQDDQNSFNVAPEELHAFFKEHRNSLIVDVREAHEFHFAEDWSAFDLETPPRNVPLTRLGDFLASLLQQEQPEREMIFVCRSGNRSGKAAQVLRRLGIPVAWHIVGGIALGTQPSQAFLDAEEFEYAI